MNTYTKIERCANQACVFALDSFILYTGTILKELLKALPRFIIGGPNYIRYADDNVLMADTESKLQDFLNSVVNES